MTLDEIDLDLVREKLASVLTEKRFIHSLNVADTVVKMAKHYGADEKGHILRACCTIAVNHTKETRLANLRRRRDTSPMR